MGETGELVMDYDGSGYVRELEALNRDLLKQVARLEAELERRTAWSNGEIAKLRVEIDVLCIERDNVESEAEALKLRLEEAEAKLRKYEPSDGVMHQQLGMLLAIREAAELLDEACGILGRPEEYVRAVSTWLELPVVAQARKMP